MTKQQIADFFECDKNPYNKNRFAEITAYHESEGAWDEVQEQVVFDMLIQCLDLGGNECAYADWCSAAAEKILSGGYAALEQVQQDAGADTSPGGGACWV